MEKATEHNKQWKKVKLGDLISDSYAGGTPNRARNDYFGGDIPWVSSGEVNNPIIDSTIENITQVGLNNSSARWIPENSILLALYGATAGQVSMLKIRATANQAVLAIIPNNEVVDTQFLFYQIFHNKQSLLFLAQGSGQPNLSKSIVDRLDISYPADLSAQRRIAAILTSADKVIDSTRRLIEKYKKMKQGMMEDLLKPKEGWKMVRLGEVGEINPSNKEPIPNQFIYIDLESVIAGKLLVENFILKGNAPSRAQRLVYKNDVLYQTVRPYQRNNYIHKKQGNYVASTGYALIRCCDDYEPDFVYYLLHTHNFESVVLGLCTGTSYPAIAPNNLKRVEIAVPFNNNMPDLAEQRRIAAILSGIDSKIAAEEKVLEKYEKVKKGLMERLLNEQCTMNNEQFEI